MTLKPDSVIDAITKYYKEHPSCHNRAIHEFGEKTSKLVDQSRQKISKFINCEKDNQIIFTKNTTESLNIISNIIDLKEGDIVLTTQLEHNSNLLPWQFLKIKKNIVYQQIPISPDLESLDLALIEEFFKNNNVKALSLFHTSNVTGLSLPIKEITKIAHKYGVLVILDAAQALSHTQIDVQDLGVDYMACSIHKAFGPTGVGILYGKKELLEKAIPPLVGGEGILDTTYLTCTLESSPKKFEVGLQNYAGIIGSGAAIDFLKKINFRSYQQYLQSLNQSLTDDLLSLDSIKLIGPKSASLRSGVCNFIIKNKNPAEIGLLLSKTSRIMLRSGVHCAHSWYHEYNLSPSMRVSLSLYNTQEEVDTFISELKKFI